MLDLTPRDFHRVRSVLNELVCESNFFPVDAKNDDWFRPREDVEAFARRSTRTTTTATTSPNTMKGRRRRYRAHSEDGCRSAFVIARRPRCHSMDSIESSSTTTETLSASSCGGGGVEPPTMRKVPTEQYDDAANAVSSVCQEDVEPRSILGVGGFSEVRLVRLLRMRSNVHANTNANSR